MANQNSKESAGFLWLIVPIGVALTLLFVSVNSNVAAKRRTLDAAIPAAEMKHEVDVKEHADSTAKKDTTAILESPKEIKTEVLTPEVKSQDHN